MLLTFAISGGLLLLYELLSALLLLGHSEPKPSKTPPVSILIPAHNERGSLRAKLPAILEAMNEGDELIVVDDGSDDGTYPLLLEMSVEHPLVLVRNYSRQGKKRAVDIGARKATHSYILQTDADCHPRSSEWIDRMRGAARKGASIILGWGAIEGNGGFLDALTRYDTARTAIGYSAFALLGNPYMGVGRNLLYQKTLRTARSMSANYYRTMGGDDDLFVQERKEAGKTTCIRNPKAHTLSPPPSTWKEHWRRKRRHAEAGLQYTFFTLFLLAFLRFAELLFVISSLILFFSDMAVEVLLGYCSLMLFRGILMGTLSKPLTSGLIALTTPILAFISLMNHIFVELSVIVSKPTQWR